MSSYTEKFNDPRWQKKRLKIFERDCFSCSLCGESGSTLSVHHGFYEFGMDPWDYPDGSLHTVCQACHEQADDARRLLRALIGSLLLESQLQIVYAMQAMEFVSDVEKLVLITRFKDLCIEFNNGR